MIFISYKSQEENIMLEVRKQLTDSGYQCWSANPNILGGGNYLEEIPKAIRNADAFLLLLSARAQTSKVILNEVSHATSLNKPLFAINIDGCDRNEAMTFAFQTNQIISGKGRIREAVRDQIRAFEANGILPKVKTEPDYLLARQKASPRRNAAAPEEIKVEIKAKEAPKPAQKPAASRSSAKKRGKMKWLVLLAIAAYFVIARMDFSGEEPRDILALPSPTASPTAEVKADPVQNVGENWLLANIGTPIKPEYCKIAEIGDIEGFECTAQEGYSDKNLPCYQLIPLSADAPADVLFVQTENIAASRLGTFTLENLGSSGEIIRKSESLEEAVINGIRTYSIFAEYSQKKRYIGKEYIQTAHLYMETGIEDKSIFLQATTYVDDEGSFPDIEAVKELLHSVAASIKLES